ncbi:hypothetical protein HJG54_32860 [Leptolyngbya sp. NK1-12]|uniref:Uncharacterized protein n=1 Tax=Leptolyngbya sp. NK1-12 TaxID=2547451 RepID=A0AA96WLE2_9CYAN|nr:hypothetical protein [Leptolyngbya sp. NK1-12]MBF2047152.1 hypothetical protein [Elainella sp. C42_A2020_010]RNJ67227.1 MAG: hypothetical protein EDM05_21830 [Leptolyngbya sp. IPPAS B-1204]WNZ27643.1 hypothetical protein HJG54_32860 [Leptolyngbya sp. NK1-12]
MEHFVDLSHLIQTHPERIRLELTYQHPATSSGAEASSSPMELSVKIPPDLSLVLGMQLDICLTSGFGEFQIVTDRSQKHKVRLLMKAGRSYNVYIPDQDLAPIVRWLQQVQKYL